MTNNRQNVTVKLLREEDSVFYPDPSEWHRSGGEGRRGASPFLSPST